MFKFNFKRSVVLSRITKCDNGDLMIHTHSRPPVRIPATGLVLVKAQELDDTSRAVVDFGPAKAGKAPTRAIVAVDDLICRFDFPLWDYRERAKAA